MVTITFTGNAEEVLFEMQQFMDMKNVEEKPLTPLAATLKPSLETKVKEELKKHEEKPKTLAILQKEAKKATKEEPKKVEEAPKKEAPKKEAPKKVEEAPKPEAPKEEAPKEEPKQDAPMTEEQMAELRTLCMNYCKKVPDGKERIKQLLKGKGCARVTDLKQKDIPEFKALVQI